MYVPYADLICSKHLAHTYASSSVGSAEMRSSVASAALLVTCLVVAAAARSTGRTTLSVLSFGAVGDGVTDDAQVRTAIAKIILMHVNL
jgi:polygalacturonase